MACSGEQTTEVMEEVGLAYEDIGTISRKHVGVEDLLQGSGAGGSSLRVGDMGDDPPHGPVPGGGSRIRCLQVLWYGNHGSVRKVGGSTPLGGGDAGGMLIGGRYIRPDESEYGCAVHCNAENYEPL